MQNVQTLVQQHVRVLLLQDQTQQVLLDLQENLVFLHAYKNAQVASLLQILEVEDRKVAEVEVVAVVEVEAVLVDQHEEETKPMRKRLLGLLVATVALTGTTYAQYAGDAMRFSETNYASSARFKGMGGAQIGVGGDISSLGGNPAGLGLFTRSEFSFSPEFSNLSTKSSYFGQGLTTDKTIPTLGQVGAVFYLPTYNYGPNPTNKGVLSFVAGVGYNRTADYNLDFNYGGTNSQNSFADYFAELGGSSLPSSLSANSLEKWAYNNYLISYDPSGYYFPETFVNNEQNSSDVHKGNQSELNVSGAINISNKFYIGASLNFVNMRYTRNSNFNEKGLAREYDNNGDLTGVNIPYNFTFSQVQESRGEGVNGRIGVIFRPVPEFRIGANLQTPTYMEISDSYTESLDNRATSGGLANEETYDYTYRLKTPLKASLGASYVIANSAIISADVDFIDYASAKLSDPYSNDVQLVNSNNNEIKSRYQEAINFRLGAEIKLDNNFALRGGYAVNGSPYKGLDDLTTQIYTGGIGYRMNDYSIDLAYQRMERDSNFSPYTLANSSSPTAQLNNTKNNIMLSIGVRF